MRRRRRSQNLTAGRRCAGINEPSAGRKQVSLNVNHLLLAYLVLSFCPPPVYSSPEEVSLFAIVTLCNVWGLNWDKYEFGFNWVRTARFQVELHYKSKYPGSERFPCCILGRKKLNQNPTRCDILNPAHLNPCCRFYWSSCRIVWLLKARLCWVNFANAALVTCRSSQSVKCK